jgi:hypothetical protein
MDHIPGIELARAANVYVMEHRAQLIEAATAHPATLHFQHQERLRLARRAVIAEIRENGRRVRSIEPSELRKLIEAYLRRHPEDNVVETKVCP